MIPLHDYRGLFNEIERLARAGNQLLARRLLNALGDDWEPHSHPDTFHGAVLARQSADIACGARVAPPA